MSEYSVEDYMNEPAKWREMADTLLQSALVVEASAYLDRDRIGEMVRSTESDYLVEAFALRFSSGAGHDEMTRVSLMLSGMAIECLLKGLIFLSGDKPSNNRHVLNEMAKQAGVVPSSEEVALLDYLSEMIELGRYMWARRTKSSGFVYNSEVHPPKIASFLNKLNIEWKRKEEHRLLSS
jgi:hypothetical protein